MWVVLLLCAACVLLGAGDGATDFEIFAEFRADSEHPTDRAYVAVLPKGQLPDGTAYLRLIIDDPGPGGAVAMPWEWMPVPSTARLLFSPINYSSPTSGIHAMQLDPRKNPKVAKGAVKVHAEAWSDRRVPGDSGAGKKLGSSAPITVHYDYTFTEGRYTNFSVTASGPGEGDICFFPSAEDASELHKALRHGELFFRRVWWTGNRTTDGGKTELNQTAGVPTFNPDAFDGQQYQYAAPRFRVAWTQPGTYYLGLRAWSGSTMRNVVQSPVDGINTLVYPQVDGVFQPVAVVVPFENGSTVPIPAGFKGPTFHLPPIVGDKRVGLSKRNLTFFSGGHFYLPTMIPASAAPSQCGPDCVAAPPAAVDIDMPTGLRINTTVGPGSKLPTAPGRQRFRFPMAGWDGGLGLLMDESLVGQTKSVGFRALDAAHVNKSSSNDLDSWFNVSVLFAPRPNYTLPSTQLSTGITYGAALGSWPTDTAAGISPLDTYRRLGMNTVSTALKSWVNATDRTGPEWDGLLYGPEGSIFSPNSFAPDLSAAQSANMSSMCPGLDSSKAAAEQEKYVNAAKFHALADSNDPTTNAGYDVGYDGCLRHNEIAKWKETIAPWQADVLIYDVEGWTDMEHCEIVLRCRFVALSL